MGSSLPTRRMLLIVLVGAAIVAFFIVGLSRRDSNDDDGGCKSETFTAVDTDRSDDEALAVFVAEHEEGPIPLTGWIKTSTSSNGTIFVSDEQGHWEIVVRNGAVRSYDGCSD